MFGNLLFTIIMACLLFDTIYNNGAFMRCPGKTKPIRLNRAEHPIHYLVAILFYGSLLMFFVGRDFHRW